MDITVAVAQLEVRPKRPDTNLARMETLVAEAVSGQADLVVFPEYALTGPPDDATALGADSARYLARCQDLAVRHGVDLVPGSWAVRSGEVVFNTTYYILSTGEVAAEYRKVYLWPTEQPFITPGSEVAVVDTPRGRIGLVLCWDLAFPALFSGMARQGAELVVCPSFWSFTGRAAAAGQVANELELIDSLCTSRAVEHASAVVFCNGAGRVEVAGTPAVLCGRSQITTPGGAVAVRAAANGERLLVSRVQVDRMPAHAAGW